MQLWKKFTELMVSKKLRMGKNAVLEVENADGSTSSISLAELTALDASAAGGSAAGTGVSAAEIGSGVQTVTLTFSDVAIPLVDEAGIVAYGGLKIYDMPEGNIMVLGATSNLDVTKSSAGVNDTWNGDFGIGTVTASNNATLSSTEQNIIPTTATPTAVSGATTADGQSTGAVTLDGTATAVDVYANFLVDDADQDVTTTPCNLILNGTLTLVWVNLGDN